MPTIYMRVFDPHDQEVMMPLTYAMVGKKYIYGPEANGSRKRRRPEPLKLSWKQKIIDGYSELLTFWRKPQ